MLLDIRVLFAGIHRNYWENVINDTKSFAAIYVIITLFTVGIDLSLNLPQKMGRCLPRKDDLLAHSRVGTSHRFSILCSLSMTKNSFFFFFSFEYREQS